MSQVMGFGFPAGERLRCDNPVCDELAVNMAKVSDKDGGERDVCGCDVHFEQLLKGHANVLKRVKLRKPGERNHETKTPT